jgi:signal transduction histidine kinase
MENMLCLLSNAQKFTTEGEITVRCSLQTSFQPSTADPPSPRGQISMGDSKGDDEDVEMGSIRLEPQTATSMVHIEVEDTGIGITKENRERLFKPFMQVQIILCILYVVLILLCLH